MATHVSLQVYHIGRHLPGWFRNIAPKTALEVHEESWNAYPYTKTKFGVPFVDKFSIEVETYYEPDNGCQVSGQVCTMCRIILTLTSVEEEECTLQRNGFLCLLCNF